MRASSKRLLTVAACCAMLVSGGPVCLAADLDEAAISGLVRELNAGSLSRREAAERRLVEAGPAALPAIVAARASAHGEAAFRLRTIQRALEDAATLQTVEEGLATLSVAVARVEAVGTSPRAVRIVLRASWKQPLDPVVVRLPVASVVAEGPAGEALPAAQRLAVVEPAMPAGATAVDLPVVLLQPDHPLESLGVLRGTLRLWLAGRPHDFVLSLDDERLRSATVARTTATVEEAVVREGRLLVTARVAYDEETEALASHRSWLAECPLEVVGADGRPLARIDQTIIARSQRGLTARATFALPDARTPAGLRLEWRLPMAIHEAPFDFSVRGVALPAPAR